MGGTMPLEREKKTYDEKLSELEQHRGKFVLIHGEEIVDFFESYSDAISRGYHDFGLDPFLVKRIEGTERIQLITRLLDPACR